MGTDIGSDTTMRDDADLPADLHAAAAERRALLNLAYRMLGTAGEAEDAVQEAYVRWYRLDAARQAAIDQPRAWLLKTLGRICLDMLGSARARRERYVGQWLPEPLPGPGHEQGADPADRITVDESVTMALLLVLEAMTPAERVTFVLHEVFRYPFAEIAEIVGRSPGACRQLAHSARRRVAARQSTTPAHHRTALAERLRTAWTNGDLPALLRVLDPDATVVTDGGGLVTAALEPVHGAEPVARFLLDVFGRAPGLVVEPATVNGEPGLRAHTDGTTLAVIALGITDDRIDHLWVVRNPDKLTAWP
ncbi:MULTISPECIES: RNA polymerase sigma factor SigJ [Nocardia]|nr:MULTISPECIES: RNA polymerase sigma factor SigJ [Nocardia]UEX21113.1 RNA polymerase sigma factor SigJ [Nocardia farcinica]